MDQYELENRLQKKCKYNKSCSIPSQDWNSYHEQKLNDNSLLFEILI